MKPIGLMARIAFGGVIVLVGCGDDGLEHGIDAPVSGDFVMAAHTPLPQMLPHADVVLDHPKLVTITFSNYAAKAQVEAWGDAVVDSNWWATEGAEWGISTMTHDAKITLGPAPTVIIEDVTIEALIKNLIETGMVPAPPSQGSEYVYMIYIPATVPLGDSLQGFYGYHAQLTTPAGGRYAYAVILDDNSGIDTVTSTASHELIESATDPFDAPQDGWAIDVPLPDPWYMTIGEIADLCGFEPVEQEGSYVYQRIWSNAAAAADSNPCVPSHDEPWNNVTADPAEMPTIAAGDSVTFTLTGWSTAQMDDWSVLVSDPADYSDLTVDEMNPQLDGDTINNGTTLGLTLTAPVTAHSGEVGGVYVYSGDYYRPWMLGFVVQ